MNDWEVIDDVPLGTTQSQEVIKKAPPVVKEKPRNKATSEEKKVPILPSQMVLQQSNPNPKMVSLINGQQSFILTTIF